MPSSDKVFFTVTYHPTIIMGVSRKHAKGKLSSFLLGICLIYILLNWIPQFISFVFPLTLADAYSQIFHIDSSFFDGMPSISLAILVYSFLLAGVFSLAESLYTLTFIRNKSVEVRCISEAFGLYGKALLLYVVVNLIVSVGFMLFIVPGFFAALNLSQAYFILADDPSKPIMQILRESTRMMNGNKRGYFKLIIFYLPFVMVSMFPSYFIQFTQLMSGMNPILATCLILILEIPQYMAFAYMRLGQGTFYELILNGIFENFKYENQDAFREGVQEYR